MTHATVNGVPASVDDLVPLAFAGYGHYTSMQMRGGRVRGFGYHLDRLRSASRELFGVAVPDERVREYIRATATGDSSVVVHMFVGAADFPAFEAGRPVEPSVLVRARPPVPPGDGSVRVRTVRFGRYLPHLKNAATMGLVEHHRRAVADGYDDALFVDGDGVIAEGTAWNILFLDADGTTVFPVAPMLVGTMLQVVRTGFTGPVADRVVRASDLAGLRGAALTNSINAAQPISAVDGHGFPVDEEWLARLRAAYAETGAEPV